MIDNGSTAARAKEVREDRGFSQAEVARLLNTHQASIAKIENATNGISRNMRPKLASVYALAEGELFAPPGSPIPPPNKPLASAPPPKAVSVEKSKIGRRNSPRPDQVGQDADTRKLLRLWSEIPADRRTLALSVMQNLRDDAVLRKLA